MRAHLHPDSVTWKLHFNEDLVFLFTSTSSVQGNFTNLLWKKKKKNKLKLSHILKSSLGYEMPKSCNVALRTIAYFSTCMVPTTEIWVNNKQIAGGQEIIWFQMAWTPTNLFEVFLPLKILHVLPFCTACDWFKLWHVTTIADHIILLSGSMFPPIRKGKKTE